MIGERGFRGGAWVLIVCALTACESGGTADAQDERTDSSRPDRATGSPFVLPPRGTSQSSRIEAGRPDSPRALERCQQMELEKARAGQWPAVLVQSPASLRSTPLDLRDAEWLEAAARLGFPVDDGVDSGCFVNAYESLGAEIVIDHATGLEWQKRPSKSMSFAEVDAYVVRFNEAIGANLAWRLPTNEELASLIDWAVYSDGTRVDSWVFETPSDLYWSADYRIADGERHQWALDVRSAILSFAWPEDRSKKRVRLVRNATEQDDG